MRTVSQSMGNVVKGMDAAMKTMDLEKVCTSSTSTARGWDEDTD
jgi:hypothetical protein